MVSGTINICIAGVTKKCPAEKRRGMIINSPGNHSSPVVRIRQQTLQWLKLNAVDEKVFG
jgi:hypothetical protein